MSQVQSQLLASGHTPSTIQLCRWFKVPRSTAYYQPGKSKPRPVIDCCTREVLGHTLEPTGKTRTVERALEEALLSRFGTLHSAPEGMLLRHDNGLVFGSRNFRAVIKDYGLTQEYITPYTPKQNGLCERFIKTFKEEFCWCNRFDSIAEARLALRAWIHSCATRNGLIRHSTTTHLINRTRNYAKRPE